MSYLHDYGILHRYLKPDNILFDDFLFPKICDFGLSKSNNRFQGSIILKTSAGIIKGTPKFNAPEIWSRAEYSKSSDVFAFSIVLYKIMTSDKQFSNEDIFSLGFDVKNSNRPKFNVEQEPKSRPTIDQILSELKTDRGYITENVNEDKYLNYTKYIDGYKTIFNSNKCAVKTSTFSKYKSTYLNQVDEKVNDNVKVIESFTDNRIHFPFKYFKFLSVESQKIVRNADADDIEKSFEVGRPLNLIEGRKDFPIDLKLGFDFIKKSIDKDYKPATIYYIDMLIKVELIPLNHKIALNLIENKLSDDESLVFFGERGNFKERKNAP